ncbi:hypothetical protein [Jeotgalibacillus campisalis]|uniref:Uncharacterized protein n=1 Tax=Jeotgalibacillus campisalis TaxID=220754 RepID=A0A0C2VV02_9BACL|nr:hypothetical protein [Jeotgalibacillus campisalis]KIL47828.1 hypothetical protein KR50_19950 [Jeotgalibacillus campisalis]
MRKVEDDFMNEMEQKVDDYVTVTADDQNFYNIRRENLHQLVSLGYKQIK